jgi:phosphatidylinositol alpha-mannosyltransferase
VAHRQAGRGGLALTGSASTASGILDAVSTSAPAEQAPATARDSRLPLKVGIVSPYGYPHPGGVNEHVRFTYEAMRRMGHDAWIITSKYGRERESEGHVIRLGTGWAAPANGSVGRVTLGLRFKRQAREVLAEHRFDVLHFHEPFVPFLSPTMLDASETVNVGTFHAFGGFSPSYWIGSRFAGRLADKLDGRIAVSTAARHFIGRYFPGEYAIIPNGVDLERFQTAEPLEELRDGILNILFVGRFEERKGLIHLLKAYHRLRKRKVDARLLVIGAGPKQREYRRFVGLRGIRDVEWLGRVSDDDKVRYFASADIFCAPNTGQESFGIVLLEAMAAGVPIVASDIHGFKRVVERNVQGLLVEPRNPRALAAALYRLAIDPDLRHDLGEAGRARAPEFSWDRVTERIVDFYYETRERVLAERG